MSHTTSQSAAEYINTDPSAIPDGWVEGVSQLIDNWRGSLYPPEPEAFTERLDGTGTVRVYLSEHIQVGEITAVSVNGIALTSSQYRLKYGSVIERVQPSDALTYPTDIFSAGVQNVTVTGTTQGFKDLLEVAANEILLLISARKKFDNLLRVFPMRLREFTDGGGAITGHDDLQTNVLAILKLYLPRGGMVS